MLRNIKFVLIIIFFLVPLGSSGFAKNFQQNQQKIRWYEGYWSGIFIGDLIAKFDDRQMEVEISSRGLVWLLTKYHNKTIATYKIKDDKVYPLKYISDTYKRTGHNIANIEYNKDGTLKKTV